MTDRLIRSLSRDKVIRSDGRSKVIRGGRGAPGFAAVTDIGFGFENFSGGQLLRGVALAHPLNATDANSIAYTATPPIDMEQVVDLYDNGALIGTAIWEIGQHFGVIDTGGGHAFAARDFPSFGAPDTLDPNFSHFSITYAGP